MRAGNLLISSNSSPYHVPQREENRGEGEVEGTTATTEVGAEHNNAPLSPTAKERWGYVAAATSSGAISTMGAQSHNSNEEGEESSGNLSVRPLQPKADTRSSDFPNTIIRYNSNSAYNMTKPTTVIMGGGVEPDRKNRLTTTPPPSSRPTAAVACVAAKSDRDGRLISNAMIGEFTLADEIPFYKELQKNKILRFLYRVFPQSARQAYITQKTATRLDSFVKFAIYHKLRRENTSHLRCLEDVNAVVDAIKYCIRSTSHSTQHLVMLANRLMSAVKTCQRFIRKSLKHLATQRSLLLEKWCVAEANARHHLLTAVEAKRNALLYQCSSSSTAKDIGRNLQTIHLDCWVSTTRKLEAIDSCWAERRDTYIANFRKWREERVGTAVRTAAEEHRRKTMRRVGVGPGGSEVSYLLPIHDHSRSAAPTSSLSSAHPMRSTRVAQSHTEEDDDDEKAFWNSPSSHPPTRYTDTASDRVSGAPDFSTFFAAPPTASSLFKRSAALRRTLLGFPPLDFRADSVTIKEVCSHLQLCAIRSVLEQIPLSSAEAVAFVVSQPTFVGDISLLPPIVSYYHALLAVGAAGLRVSSVPSSSSRRFSSSAPLVTTAASSPLSVPATNPLVLEGTASGTKVAGWLRRPSGAERRGEERGKGQRKITNARGVPSSDTNAARTCESSRSPGKENDEEKDGDAEDGDTNDDSGNERLGRRLTLVASVTVAAAAAASRLSIVSHMSNGNTTGAVRRESYQKHYHHSRPSVVSVVGRPHQNTCGEANTTGLNIRNGSETHPYSPSCPLPNPTDLGGAVKEAAKVTKVQSRPSIIGTSAIASVRDKAKRPITSEDLTFLLLLRQSAELNSFSSSGRGGLGRTSVSSSHSNNTPTCTISNANNSNGASNKANLSPPPLLLPPMGPTLLKNLKKLAEDVSCDWNILTVRNSRCAHDDQAFSFPSSSSPAPQTTTACSALSSGDSRGSLRHRSLSHSFHGSSTRQNVYPSPRSPSQGAMMHHNIAPTPRTTTNTYAAAVEVPRRHALSSRQSLAPPPRSTPSPTPSRPSTCVARPSSAPYRRMNSIATHHTDPKEKVKAQGGGETRKSVFCDDSNNNNTAVARRPQSARLSRTVGLHVHAGLATGPNSATIGIKVKEKEQNEIGRTKAVDGCLNYSSQSFSPQTPLRGRATGAAPNTGDTDEDLSPRTRALVEGLEMLSPHPPPTAKKYAGGAVVSMSPSTPSKPSLLYSLHFGGSGRSVEASSLHDVGKSKEDEEVEKGERLSLSRVHVDVSVPEDNTNDILRISTLHRVGGAERAGAAATVHRESKERGGGRGRGGGGDDYHIDNTNTAFADHHQQSPSSPPTAHSNKNNREAFHRPLLAFLQKGERSSSSPGSPLLHRNNNDTSRRRANETYSSPGLTRRSEEGETAVEQQQLQQRYSTRSLVAPSSTSTTITTDFDPDALYCSPRFGSISEHMAAPILGPFSPTAKIPTYSASREGASRRSSSRHNSNSGGFVFFNHPTAPPPLSHTSSSVNSRNAQQRMSVPR